MALATIALAAQRKKTSSRTTAAAAPRKPAPRPAPAEPSTREQVDLFGAAVPPQEAQQEPLWSLPAVDDDEEEFELEDEDDEEPI